MEVLQTCFYKIAKWNKCWNIEALLYAHIYFLDIKYLDKICVANSNWNVHPKCQHLEEKSENWTLVFYFLGDGFEAQMVKKWTKLCFWIAGAEEVPG